MPLGVPVQAPGLNRRRIGDTLVTILSDGYLDVSFDLLSGIDAREAESVLAERNTSTLPHLNVNVYVVQAAGRTILIDGGAGGLNGWGGRLSVALAAASIDPLDIDEILLTHAHPDHVGGLAGPMAVPHFPNATKLHIHEAELAFWADDAVRAGAPDAFRPFFDVARNAFDAYRDKISTFRHGEVCPGINAVSLPGHTPGHTGYLLSDSGRSLLIWGDTVHFPHIQVSRPHVSVAMDVEPAVAASTRLALLDRASSDRLMISGMHFNAPLVGYIERRSDAYELVYETWSAALI